MKSVNEAIQTSITSSNNRIAFEPYLIENHNSFKSSETAEVSPKAPVTENNNSTLITELGNQLLAALKINNTIT